MAQNINIGTYSAALTLAAAGTQPIPVVIYKKPVLNFPDKIITGINIIDDFLFWTDGETEPKKINIQRSKDGTGMSGFTPTKLININTGIYLLSNVYVREEHISVIKKSPKNALSLELETGRDTSLNYTGITSIGDPTSITAPITISDFSSIAIGDNISFNISSDYDSSLTFALAWQPGQFILLKEAPDTSNLPGIPLANWTIRGKILSQPSNNFDSANGIVNVTIEIIGLNGVPDDPDPSVGYLNYIVELENTEPSIFEDKFPRFSYRYKYSDNEYSTFAPWSEVAFLPTTLDYDPKKGWNKGMVNNIRFIKISGFRPSVYGLPTGKDVIEVDILYKEDSSPNVYLVETISPIDILQSGLSTIPWYSDEYIIDSETIKSTIASNQLLRPWDNVPKKALAQEVSGNRVIYGNYEQNYDLKVGGLKYKPNFTNSIVAWGEPAAGSPQKSIKSLRDYKLGVVFTDKYGRETPVIISESGGFKVNKQQSISANRLTVGLNGQPPAEMAYYKFYVKETSTEYYSIAMDRWYAAEDGNIWLAFPSSDRNKVDLDTSLYFKKGNDGDNNAIENSTKYKILAIENEAPEWIKTKRVRIGTVNHNVPGDSQIFGVPGSTTTNAPTVSGISFTMEYGTTNSNHDFISTTLSHMEDIKEDIYVQFVRAGDRSAQYKVSEITSNRVVATGIPTQYFVTLDKAFEEDINFIFDVPVSPSEILDDTRIIFTKAVIENKPQFDGRFFAKIENDGKIQTMISEDSLGFNYIESSSKMVYSISGRVDYTLHAHASVGRIVSLNYSVSDAYYNWCGNSNWSDNTWFCDSYNGDGYDDNPSYVNTRDLYARQSYFMDLSDNTGISPSYVADYNPMGVWFIDDSNQYFKTKSTGCDDNVLKWRDENNMDDFSPSCNNPYTSGCGWTSVGGGFGKMGGITNYSNKSNVKISYGGIKGTGNKTLKLTLAGSYSDCVGNYHLDTSMADFFSIGTTHPHHSDVITKDFVKNLSAGSIFKWREDPTETIYTIENQTTCSNHLRFARHADGNCNHNTKYIGDPSSYHKQWGFNTNKPISAWNPTDPNTFISSGLQLGDATGPARHIKTTSANLAVGAVTLSLLDTNGLKPGMSAMHANLPLHCKIISILSSSVTLSVGPTTLQISSGSTVDFGYTIRLKGGSIFNTSINGITNTNLPNENYIIVDNITTECSNGNNLKTTYSLHKGMWLDYCNLETATSAQNGQVLNYVVKDLQKDSATGFWRIDLGGYYSPISPGSGYNSIDVSNMQIDERMVFKQVAMNGASNFSESNTDHYLQSDPIAPFSPNQDKTGSIVAVGYTMEFLSVVDQYSDGGYLPEDPFIWETEPKDNTELDIYYEISENNPIVLNPDTINIAIPIGSKVASIAGAGGISDNTYVSSVGGGNGNQIKISELAWVGPGNALDGTLPLISGSTLEITRPNGTVLSVNIQNVVQMPTPPFTFSKIFELDPSLFNSEYKLNWHNCWSFGNGVESNRIKDTFNSPFIGHGVKVSTTSDDYKKEHRKSGLIYSGLYNSTSGVNNLNQFIQAEKITKDLNPTYGSIQKLYAGWGQGGDLIALCEDRILRILADKDALYNADGNMQLTSTNNVLGIAIPYAGEYGISKNPESFASEAFRCYFTDKVRSAVMRLSTDGLTPISDNGMKDWFRDHLQLGQTLIGSYDDKKSEYNITLKGTNIATTVSFREDVKGWVSFKSFVPENAISCANKYYTFLNGKLYQHHSTTVNRNTFYGLPLVNSTLEAIFNEVPGSVKSFKTINYEGSRARITQFLGADGEYFNLAGSTGWYVDDVATNLEQSGITEFIEKEGKWFGYITGDDVIINPANGLTTGNYDTEDSSIQGIGILGYVNILNLFGCTDETMFNYEPAATNTCQVSTNCCIPFIYGCVDVSADNYIATTGNPQIDVNTDDNSCLWYGCMTPLATLANESTWTSGASGSINFDPQANFDDGTCTTAIYGCTDVSAFNFDVDANIASGILSDGTSCGYGNCMCIPIITGCTDPSASNYIAPSNPMTDVNTSSNTCVFNGCTNSIASNYSFPLSSPAITATGQTLIVNSVTLGTVFDDGSCIINYGCMDVLACNYDPIAFIEIPGSCQYCGDNNAENYDNGTCDDACIYCNPPSNLTLVSQTTSDTINGVDQNNGTVTLSLNETTIVTLPSQVLSWTLACSAYILQYKVLGTTNWNPSITGITSLNYTLTDLFPNTNYEWRVKCSGAAWTGVPINSFVTGASISIPNTFVEAYIISSSLGNINEVIDASGGSPNMYGSSIVSSGWGSGVITFTLTGLPLGASIITASSLCATQNSINDWALITMGYVNPTATVVIGSPLIYGCMDNTGSGNNIVNPNGWGACNYNPLATIDDGSCVYGICAGCNYPGFMEYCDDCWDSANQAQVASGGSPWVGWLPGSCTTLIIPGCIDPTMFNYNALANVDNGSCIPFVYGCMDNTTNNYLWYQGGTTSYATNFNAAANTPCNASSTGSGNNECCNPYNCAIPNLQYNYNSGIVQGYWISSGIPWQSPQVTSGLSTTITLQHYTPTLVVTDAVGNNIPTNPSNWILMGVGWSETGYITVVNIPQAQLNAWGAGQDSIQLEFTLSRVAGTHPDNGCSNSDTLILAVGCKNALASNYNPNAHIADNSQCTYPPGCMDATLNNNGSGFAASNYNAIYQSPCGGDNSCCAYATSPMLVAIAGGVSGNGTVQNIRLQTSSTANTPLTSVGSHGSGQITSSAGYYFINTAGNQTSLQTYPLVALQNPISTNIAYDIPNTDWVPHVKGAYPNQEVEIVVRGRFQGAVNNTYISNLLYAFSPWQTQTFTAGCKVNDLASGTALNLQSNVNLHIPNSCIAVVLGCMDPTALNYDAAANTDDGSCTYHGL